ncbi:PTS sugar transporter subunit IIB [Anaerococcus murdochii]|uniref:PTS sugar transporter subunit IIB n=1 Tax=Anaerococcus murdochii TaxID=411577 RepID=A0ABS7SY36_9FIRM|nr:PTS sugar transporter subunit IIB [Anaerococcus murdochii]MBZ2386406.1 PTS sugar transporter subunit IIB [Anaerococcus murdochii]
MSVTLARIDDRLIHGQTTTRWSRERHVDGIIIIGDEVINDEVRKKVLKAAARDFKLGIYSENHGVEKIKSAMDSQKDFFIIASSPKIFDKLVKNGADFGGVLNVGCMNTRENSKVVGRTLALTGDDYEAFESLSKNGIKLEFQLLPDNDIKNWDEIKKKFNSMK